MKTIGDLKKLLYSINYYVSMFGATKERMAEIREKCLLIKESIFEDSGKTPEMLPDSTLLGERTKKLAEELSDSWLSGTSRQT